MKFVDLAKIFVKAGRGGNGALSFRREKFVPKGGPDGADGGRGGNIIIEAVSGIVTLADFEYNKRFQAGNAGHGSGAMRTGSNGEDLKIFVPCGTLIKNSQNEILADLITPGQQFLAAKGGRGGRGNAHFASSERRAPRFAEKGDLGEECELLLELKLIADVGLVGLPNAGKSSILSAISGAKPKIAGYPFTTLTPNLGVLSVDDAQVVIADLPGLIEGAHEGKGLGLQFLRHAERTRVLLHVLDLSEKNILENFYAVQKEFKSYKTNLNSRPCLIIGNKIDIPDSQNNIEILKNEMQKLNLECFFVSALTGQNIPELIKKIAQLVRNAPEITLDTETSVFNSDNSEPELIELPRKSSKRNSIAAPVNIIKTSDGRFKVEHSNFEKSVSRINFDHDDALMKFAALLKKLNVEEALEAAGAKQGDKVLIGEIEFDFEPDKIM